MQTEGGEGVGSGGAGRGPARGSDGGPPDGPDGGLDRGPSGGSVAGRVGSPAKDRVICALIFCVAAVAWFGWGQQGERLSAVPGIGSLLAIGATLVAIGRLRTTPGIPTMSVDAGVRRSYWFWVIAEVVLIVVGATVLSRSGRPELVPVWTLAVVGLHFLPLARVFRMPLLVGAAAGSVAAAAVALPAQALGIAPAPTVAGLLGGAVLLLCGLLGLRPARP